MASKRCRMDANLSINITKTTAKQSGKNKKRYHQKHRGKYCWKWSLMCVQGQKHREKQCWKWSLMCVQGRVYTGYTRLYTTTVPRQQSTQSAGPVRFLIFCSISIFLLASLVAGWRLQCTAGAEQQGILHQTYQLEYQICSSQPRQKSLGQLSIRFQPLGPRQ